MNALPQTNRAVVATETRWQPSSLVNPQTIGHEPVLTARWTSPKGVVTKEQLPLPSQLVQYTDATSANHAAQALSYLGTQAQIVAHDSADRWFVTSVPSTQGLFSLDPSWTNRDKIELATAPHSVVTHVYGGGRDWTPGTAGELSAPTRTPKAAALDTDLPAELKLDRIAKLSWTNPHDIDLRKGVSFGNTPTGPAPKAEGAVKVPGTLGDALLVAHAEAQVHGATAILQADDGAYWVTDVDPRYGPHEHLANPIATRISPALQALCIGDKTFDFAGWL